MTAQLREAIAAWSGDPNSMENTNNQINNGGGIFSRSQKIIRSPVLQGTTGESPREEQTEVTSMEVDPSATDFQKLGAHIGHLVAMLADGKRRSIHQEMRDTINSIKAHYELAAIHLKDDGAKEVLKTHCASQTSPWLKAIALTKRKQGIEKDTPTPKRRDGTPKEAKATPIRTKGARTPKGAKKDEWQKVKSKKATRDAKKVKQRLERSRPDAIVIQTKDHGADTYANILRKVKTDPALKAIAESVTGIRRTQKGELLLQLKETGDKTTEITNNISVALGQTATVRTLSHRISIECRDIDEITTKEEICSALNELLGSEGVAPTDVVSLRKAYGGMQTATVSLPANMAKSLLNVGKVKIGWSVCRLRERTALTKCFKCLEFGHISKQCRNVEDRSKRCRNCGEEGHIAKDCKKPASCMFCRKDSPQHADHVAGSSRCPVFRRALSRKAK